MAEHRDPKLVGRWFVVRQEGGAYEFVDKEEWDHTGAPIRGWREPNGDTTIEDSIIHRIRHNHLSDAELLGLGYTLPRWTCVCGNSAAIRPKFCPECGAQTISGTE